MVGVGKMIFLCSSRGDSGKIQSPENKMAEGN